jgi:hypothetical protein
MPDTVRFWLHVEGAAALIAGALLYHALSGDWIWLIPLLLVPDIRTLPCSAPERGRQRRARIRSAGSALRKHV